MDIIPSLRNKINFITSFLESRKEYIVQSLIKKIKELDIKILKDISYNYSYEGGIELPKTTEWNDYLYNNLNNHMYEISKYQGSRQLRFIIYNNNIIGATCKDSINIFTDEELDKIILIFNYVLLSNIPQ